jgi:hypothetical protein
VLGGNKDCVIKLIEVLLVYEALTYWALTY